MRFSTITIIILLFTTLSGCSTTGGKSSFIESQAPDAARITGSWARESMTFWEGYSLISVDDKFLSRGVFSSGVSASTRVTAGRRKIVVHANFNRGLNSGPFESYIELNAILKPSQSYIIKGRIEGQRVTAWLEDLKMKKRISDIGKSNYQKESGGTYVPIYIPAR